MSLQVCHCGWSKVTSYRGLRTHQGKMGCTPRGVKVEETEQLVYMRGNVGSIKDFELDVHTYIKTASDRSLQVCHCGWSKMTTSHGLRTHQGMMGCLSTGVRIPKKEQYDWRDQWGEVDQKKQQPAKRTAVKKENVSMPPSANVRNRPAAATFAVKEEYKSDFETPRHSFQTDMNSESHRQLHDVSIGVQVNVSLREDLTPTYLLPVVRPKEKDRKKQTLSQTADSRVMTGINNRTDSARTSATIKEEPKSPLAISQRSSQRTTNKKSVCQPRNLSTAAQVNVSLWEDLTPTYPLPVVRPKEKDRKKQTLSQIAYSRVMTATDSRTDSARTSVTVKEEPKSPLAISRRSSQTTTNKKSVCQPHDFSTAAQNLTPESVMKPVYRPPLVPLSTRINSAAPAIIKEKPKSSLAAPQSSVQKVTNSEASHQLQSISTYLQVNRSSRSCPTIPPLATVVQPQEVTKDQTLSQARQERVKSELQQKIQLRQEKMGEIMQMERACESVPDLTCTNTQMNSAAAEATIQEDPKSLCETSRPDPFTGMRGEELVQMFPAATTEETAVQPKDKNTEEQKLSQVEHLGQTPSATTPLETSVQPKEKDKEDQSLPQSEPDSTSAPTTQVNAASAEATPVEDPASSSETTQLSDFSTGLKVKELARMFSAATTQEAAVQPKEQHREQQKTTSAKLVAQKLSAATAQETAVKPKQNDEKDQNLPQNGPDSTKTTTHMNPAPAHATTEEDHTSPSETAQLSHFSTGLKVKELARMFSAATKRETAVRPQEKHREQQKTTSQVKLIGQKLSATTAKETAVKPKQNDENDQSLPQNGPNSTSTTTQMHPASAEAATKEDPKSSFETVQVSDFCTGLKVKELARMFSAATTQETAVRPKEKHREPRKPPQWI